MRNDEYPSVRRAILGRNGHVANAYCAVKWALWQVSHVLLAAVVVAVVIPAAWLFNRIGVRPPKPVLVAGAVLKRVLDRVANSIVGKALWYAAFVVVAVAGSPVWVVMAIGIYLYQGSRLQALLHRGRDTAKDTPGVRRLYGECPVSMDIEPKWFVSVMDAFERHAPGP